MAAWAANPDPGALSTWESLSSLPGVSLQRRQTDSPACPPPAISHCTLSPTPDAISSRASRAPQFLTRARRPNWKWKGTRQPSAQRWPYVRGSLSPRSYTVSPLAMHLYSLTRLALSFPTLLSANCAYSLPPPAPELPPPRTERTERAGERGGGREKGEKFTARTRRRGSGTRFSSLQHARTDDTTAATAPSSLLLFRRVLLLLLPLLALRYSVRFYPASLHPATFALPLAPLVLHT